MTKICSRCKDAKPLNQFNKHKGSKDGLQWECKACQKEYNIKRYENSRPNLKNHHLSEESFNALLESQDNRCAICHRPLYGIRAVIDHDHNCCEGRFSCGRCVRGILCVNCNTGLGGFRDNIIHLVSAIKYLETVTHVNEEIDIAGVTLIYEM